MKGEPIEGCDFSLLAVEPSMLDTNSRISQSLLTPVMKLSTNSWFVLNTENGTAKHIKLILKDEDTQHLIFTNRSGGSALQTSFEEFAYLLSSEKVTQLPQPGDLVKNIRRSLAASLKLKVKTDQVFQKRQKREAEESLVQALSDTQFVLLALSKEELENEANSEIVLKKSAVHAAIALTEETTELIFVDQSGFNLDIPAVDEIIKLATGINVQIEDDAPVGMDDFKAAVSRMRKYPKLSPVGEDV